MSSLISHRVLSRIVASCCSESILKRGLRKLKNRELPVPKFEKRLDVAILGSYNVGKSVLLNTLIDTKIAATSRKRNTTRSEIVGVFNHRNVQLVFYDTPGFIHTTPNTKEETRELSKIAMNTVKKADVVLLVVDASLPINNAYKDAFAEMARLALANAKIEIILILNKVDIVEPKTELLETTYQLVSLINGVKLGPERANEAKLDTTTFMISALKDDGVIDLKNYLISISLTKPWKIPRERGVTDMTDHERVQQIVYETLLDQSHDEVPYNAEIKCTQIFDLSPSKLKIDVDITVESDRHQKILIGMCIYNIDMCMHASVV